MISHGPLWQKQPRIGVEQGTAICVTEKLVIAQADPATLLNKRTELVSKYGHMNKFKLKSLKN